jgi:hypothetical protein
MMSLQDSAADAPKKGFFLPIAQDWGFMSGKMTQVVLVKTVLPNATRVIKMITDVIDTATNQVEEDVTVTSNNFYNVQRLENPLSKVLAATLAKGQGIYTQFQSEKAVKAMSKRKHTNGGGRKVQKRFKGIENEENASYVSLLKHLIEISLDSVTLFHFSIRRLILATRTL